jgi:dTDP-4-amino-4,6-dideoxygalactose transaminase
VDTLKSGWLTAGPKTKRFEADFALYVGAQSAAAVASCTAGMALALEAAGIGPGDEVITTPLTFCATVNVIIHRGAAPILADVSPDDYNLDPEEVERRLTPRTKALMPMHYAGQPCRMDELREIARRHNLAVIEDAAHAVGARYRDRPIGSEGTAVFSFYATKNMTTGQGGMVTSTDAELLDRVRSLSLHGMSQNAWRRYEARGSWYYEVTAPGYNFAMTDLQAALGLHQLRRLEEFLTRRKEIARRYTQSLGCLDEVAVPAVRPEVRHAWHLYPLVLRPEHLTISRDEFIEALRERGIGTSVHFIPIHYHPYYRETFGFQTGDYPRCEEVFEGLVSLPIYPLMTDADVDSVADAVREITAARRR